MRGFSVQTARTAGIIIPLELNVEYDFARECESRDDIEFYFKLPF